MVHDRDDCYLPAVHGVMCFKCHAFVCAYVWLWGQIARPCAFFSYKNVTCDILSFLVTFFSFSLFFAL